MLVVFNSELFSLFFPAYSVYCLLERMEEEGKIRAHKPAIR